MMNNAFFRKRMIFFHQGKPAQGSAGYDHDDTNKARGYAKIK